MAERLDESSRSGWDRLRSLDGLRTFSITLVLVSHGLPPEARRFSRELGNLGVRWFFVISGFLITRLLLAELDRSGGISLSRFYLRRSLRIFPALYAYLLALFVLQRLGRIEPISPQSWAHALTYAINYQNVVTRSWYVAHLWSLAVEEQFYLLWPFLLLVLHRRRATLLLAAVVLAVPALRGAIAAWFPSHVTDVPWHFETVCDALATGCLLAGCREWLWRQPTYRRWLRPRFVSAVFAAVFVVNWLGFSHQRMGFLFGQTAMNAGIALCIDFCLRRPDNLVGRILNQRTIVFLGTLSYSIYLWQQPFFSEMPGLIRRFPANLALTLALAAASHFLIERPFLRLKEKLASRPAAARPLLPEQIPS